MTSLSRQNAKEKANEVNDLSLSYHLSHATVACNILIRKELQELLEAKIQELNEKKKTANREKNRKEFVSLMKKQVQVLDSYSKLQIYVEYLKEPEETAVTVRVGDQLVIYLPQKLLDKSRVNGRYTEDVARLRKLMAHELGHAILHTKELVEMEGHIGSTAFNGTEKEEEAKIFGKTLLDLRHDRNMRMRNDRTMEHFF